MDNNNVCVCLCVFYKPKNDASSRRNVFRFLSRICHIFHCVFIANTKEKELRKLSRRVVETFQYFIALCMSVCNCFFFFYILNCFTETAPHHYLMLRCNFYHSLFFPKINLNHTQIGDRVFNVNTKDTFCMSSQRVKIMYLKKTNITNIKRSWKELCEFLPHFIFNLIYLVCTCRLLLFLFFVNPLLIVCSLLLVPFLSSSLSNTWLFLP